MTMENDVRFRVLTLELLDLAEQLVDPSVQESRRDQLRDVVGQPNIFDLKNALSRLCGSTAYKMNGPFRRYRSGGR